jgi:SAM-dependent methyltransferase
VSYNDIYKAGLELNRYPSDILVSWVFNNKFSSGLKCLDIGCGYGNNLRFLLENGFDAVGIDNSEFVINLIKNEFKDRVFIKSIISTNFNDKSFDILIDRQSIQHNSVNDLVAIYNECQRLLKDDGFFFCNFNLSKGNRVSKANIDEIELDKLITRAFLIHEKNFHILSRENGTIKEKMIVYVLKKYKSNESI